MKKTKIQYCDSTVNPTGQQCCGCELWNPAKKVRKCYAGKFAERVAGKGAFDRPVELKPGRMAEAAAWPDLRGKARPHKPWIPLEYPRIIFIGDMADTFQPGVPFEYLKSEIIDVVSSEAGQRHIWLWLTKQAKRLAEFDVWLRARGCDWPENLWPGVSVTSASKTWRIDELVKVRSRYRWISYAPAWEQVDFSKWFYSGGTPMTGRTYAIDLVVIEGESGHGAEQFNIGWAAKVIEDCDEAHVAPFVKQIGSNAVCDNANLFDWPDDATLSGRADMEGAAACRVVTRHSEGGDWAEWPDQLKRRELPLLL